MMTRVARRGLTLIEILVALAVMATLMFAAYELVAQGFRFGADLPRRETADALGRNMLDRYTRVPVANLHRLFKASDTIELNDHEDETLERGSPLPIEALKSGGYQRQLSFEALPGDRPATALHATVSWHGPAGADRSMTFTRYFFPADGGGKPLEEASGFKSGGPGGSAPDWGRRARWAAAAHGSASGGEVAHDDAPRQIEEAARRTAAATMESGPRTFHGDPALAARLLGPGGEMSASHGDPDVVARNRTLRQEARFLTQAGVPRDSWPAELRGPVDAVARLSAGSRAERLAASLACCDDGGFARIPDGVYSYRLEAVDFRDAQGNGAVLGVYVLRQGPQRFRLVARAERLPKRADSMEGRGVVETRALRANDGQPALLKRTDERVYLIGQGFDPAARLLTIRTLPAHDPAAVAEVVAEARLVDSTAAPIDDLLAAASPRPRVSMVASAAGGPADDGGAPRAHRAAVRELAARGHAGRGSLRQTAVRFRSRIVPAQGALASVAAASGTTSARGAIAGPDSAESRADGLLREAHELAGSDPARAIGLLAERLAADPSDVDALALRGRIRAANGEMEAGVEDLLIALRQRPDDAGLVRDTAGLLMHAGRRAEARAMVDRFAALAPSDPLVETFRQSLAMMTSPSAIVQGAPATGSAGSSPVTTVGTGAGGPPATAAGPAPGAGSAGGGKRPVSSMDWGSGMVEVEPR